MGDVCAAVIPFHFFFFFFVVFIVHVIEKVVILDAADVAKGPICRLPLKNFVPHSLHG